MERVNIHVALPAAKRVAIVGERFNLGMQYQGALRSQEYWMDRVDKVGLRWLEKLGAFHHGTSHKKLVKIGVRWDGALNLIWPDTSGKWDKEDGRAAREVVIRIWGELLERYDAVFLLGRRVADAFGEGWPMLERKGPFFVIPHPSGRSRTWNDPATGARVRDMIEEATT